MTQFTTKVLARRAASETRNSSRKARKGRKGKGNMSFRPKGEIFPISLASHRHDRPWPFTFRPWRPWREEYPNPRRSGLRKFAQAARISNLCNTKDTQVREEIVSETFVFFVSFVVNMDVHVVRAWTAVANLSKSLGVFLHVKTK
ncbi:MAG: hypothetical protein ACXW5W_18095, partial [Candidatus Binatia bacterium]